MSAIELALLAMLAADGGDTVTAQAHIDCAQRQVRTTARRQRQLLEIAALAVSGELMRAAGLVLEHTNEFPADAELLTRLLPRETHDARPERATPRPRPLVE